VFGFREPASTAAERPGFNASSSELEPVRARNPEVHVLECRKPTIRMSRRAAALLLSLVVGLVLVSTAEARTSDCGKAVAADWFDNDLIDGVYELHCYSDGLDALPPEILDYTSAEDVIGRAFQAASHGRRLAIRPRTSDGEQPKPLPPVVDTSAPSDVPITIVVLGVLSLSLLAAGGASYVVRRRRGDDVS
jgi:hypothetical protein